jgi:hypothetical protein
MQMRQITTKKGVKLSVPEKGEKHPNAGRPKGSKNVMTLELREAFLLAVANNPLAEKYGGGLVGYFRYMAIKQPALTMRLLGKLMLMEEKERAKAARRSYRPPMQPMVYKRVEEGQADTVGRELPISQRLAQKPNGNA